MAAGGKPDGAASDSRKNEPLKRGPGFSTNTGHTMKFSRLREAAGKAATAVKEKAELTALETITLPDLYRQIGVWLAKHTKLPADLLNHVASIRDLERDQAAARAAEPDGSGDSLAAKAKQLAGKAAQAARDAAFGARIRSAYTTMGKHAFEKYGEKVVPAEIREPLRNAIDKQNQLRSSGEAAQVPSATASESGTAPKPAAIERPQVVATKPLADPRPAKKRRFMISAFAGVLAVVAALGLAFKYVPLLMPEQRSKQHAVDSAESSTASADSGSVSTQGFKRPEVAFQAMFPVSFPRLEEYRECRTLVLGNGNVLTASDSNPNDLEFEVTVRSRQGKVIAQGTVEGIFRSSDVSAVERAVYACGASRAAIRTSRGGSDIRFVMLDANGKKLWETDAFETVKCAVPFGDGGLLVAGDLLVPLKPGERISPFWGAGWIYYWTPEGKRLWGHEGGGPFRRELVEGSPNRGFYERFNDGRAVVAENGNIAFNLSYVANQVPRPDKSRAVVSLSPTGEVLAEIVEGEGVEPPQLLGVLSDGGILTQDKTNQETVVLHGTDGREVARFSIGECLVAKSARKNGDVFLSSSGGVVRRVARDGSDVWRFSCSKDLPAPEWKFTPAALIEASAGAGLLCDNDAAVYLDSQGRLRKCCRWKEHGYRERPRLVDEHYVVWPSKDGSFVVGDVRKW